MSWNFKFEISEEFVVENIVFWFGKPYKVVCWGGAYIYLITELLGGPTQKLFYMNSFEKKRKRESCYPLFFQLNFLPIQYLYIICKVLNLFYLRSGNTGATNLLYTTGNISCRIFRTPQIHKFLFKHSFAVLNCLTICRRKSNYALI